MYYSLKTSLGFGLLLIGCVNAPPEEEPSGLYPLDSELQVTLVSNAPDLVTPIGLAIDRQDHIFILESHTHSPTKDYEGPKYDRIKVGRDDDGDGLPDQWQIFADGIEAGMNLTVDDKGTIYLVTKDQVISYHDEDGDGVSDRQRILLHMVSPDQIYVHAGLLGITSSADGWLYVTRGNTSGKRWRLEGSDGKFIEGFGDGGNIVRCRKDGSQVEEMATGFWNPFSVAFSTDGRLLVTDNDPDSRGPNRLVEIVKGGDYGYKSLYGGSGIHPFLAWNGELPGTLPYAAPLGEAPCGIIDASYTNLPSKYQGQILAAIWEENTIVHIPLRSKGSSVEGMPQVLIQGDSLFHPVAMAINSRGDLYVTDWVIRQYPNHGEGRLWMISGEKKQPGKAYLEAKHADHAMAIPTNRAQAKRDLLSPDPFVRTKARNFHDDSLIHDLINASEDPLKIEGLLMASEVAMKINDRHIVALLSSKNERVQEAVLLYLSTCGQPSARRIIERAFASGVISPSLFETYLATIRHLNPTFIQGKQQAKDRRDNELERKLPEGFIQAIVEDQNLPPRIRAKALATWEKRSEHFDVLAAILKKERDEDLLEAGVLSMRLSEDPLASGTLLDYAINSQNNVDLRALAIVALISKSDNYCPQIVSLLQEDVHLLSVAVLRYLKKCSSENSIAGKVSVFLAKAAESLSKIWNQTEGTKERSEITGDPAVGKITFHLPQAQCQTCHKIDGWGGVLGPDLSNIGSSKTSEQLAESIVDPSAQIAPEWQGWFVIDEEGNYHVGRQIDVGRKDVELMDMNGEFITYKEPKDYGLAEASLMPPGLHLGLTAYEFAGLVAYLEELR